MSTLAELKEISSKAAEVASKARAKSVTDQRNVELKKQFFGWMDEYRQKELGIKQEFRHDVEEVNQKEGSLGDLPKEMLMKSAELYGKQADEVREFQQQWDRWVFAKNIMRTPAGIQHVKMAHMKSVQQYVKRNTGLSKALATSITDQGIEWMETDFLSTDFIQRVESEFQLPSIHRRIAVPRGVQSIDIGGSGSPAQVFFVAESISDESDKISTTTPKTRKVTLTPKGLKARTLTSREQDEDSAVAMAEFVRDELVMAYSRGVEGAFINGDTAGTMDVNDPDGTSMDTSNHRWRIFNGYRQTMLAATKIDANDTVNVAAIRQMFQAMQNYGKPGALFLVTGPVGFWKLSVLSELLTIDKYGANATILRGLLPGERGQIMGAPVIWSDEIREDLNESFVHDNVTTNETQIIGVYRDGWVSGIKRDAEVASEFDIDTDQIKMVVTGRLDFQARYVTTTERVTGQIYDVNTGT